MEEVSPELQRAEEARKRLFDSIAAGEPAGVMRAIEDGADVNDLVDGSDLKGASALIIAASHGNAGIIRMLVDAGANVNHVLPEQDVRNHTAIVDLLNPSPSAKEEPPTERFQVSDNEIKERLTNHVRPQYPPLLRQGRVQGTVKLSAVIAKDGTVQSLKALSGPRLLVTVAMDAVKQWRYRPTLVNGEAVEVLRNIDVNFALS